MSDKEFYQVRCPTCVIKDQCKSCIEWQYFIHYPTKLALLQVRILDRECSWSDVVGQLEHLLREYYGEDYPGVIEKAGLEYLFDTRC